MAWAARARGLGGKGKRPRGQGAQEATRGGHAGRARHARQGCAVGVQGGTRQGCT